MRKGTDSLPGDRYLPPTLSAGGSVAALAIRSSIWTLGGYAATQLLRLASNLILARLLFPAAFGQVALVFIFIQGLSMFSDVGTGTAIIQSARGDDPTFVNTAWTIQCVRGGILWVASGVIAWPVAAFYGQPMLGWLIPAAGLSALIEGFESTSIHTLQRHLRRERLTIVEFARQFVGIAITVILAMADRWVYGPNDPNAVWSIVAGSLAGSAAWVLLSHTYLPGIRNRFLLDREAARHLIDFGRWIFVSTLLTFLALQADRLVFAKLIPMALLGVYSIASTLAVLPTEAVVKLGSAVIFPAYSRLVTRKDFPDLFWRMRLPIVLGGAAIVCALLASGPFLVRMLYDPRYADAGWILQFLSVAAWFRILEVTNSMALLAKGRVRWMAAGSAAKVAGMVGMIPLGFQVGGFRGALVGLVASEVLKYLTTASGAAVTGLRGFGRDALLTGAVAAISATGLTAGRMVAERSPSTLVGLAVSAVVAGTPWACASLWYLAREKAARASRATGMGAPSSRN